MAINLRGASYKNNTLTHAEMDNNFLSFITLASTGANAAVSNIFAPDFNSTSDLRLKENIKPIQSALEKVISLNGYTFNFIDDETKRVRSGVIAQECLDVFPEVVVEHNERYNVSYDGLVPLLIEALKEQQEQIEELKEKFNQL